MDKFGYQDVENAFRDGSIEQQDETTLRKFLVALSNQPVNNDSVRHREVIRGITINHMLLQRHIDGLNKQNRKTERWVMVLAAASLIATASQTWFAYRADKRTEEKETHTASALQTPSSQLEGPCQVLPPFSCLASAYKP